jgi:lipopolysaccharide export LptBFGC system permease protein LptF
MTLAELRRAFPDRDDARRVVFEFHSRLAIAGTPLTFVALAMVVTIRRRARRRVALAAIACAGVSYMVFLWLGRGGVWSGVIPTPLGPWLPQLVLIMTTILLGRSARRRGPSITRTPV